MSELLPALGFFLLFFGFGCLGTFFPHKLQQIAREYEDQHLLGKTSLFKFTLQPPVYVPMARVIAVTFLILSAFTLLVAFAGN